MSENRPQKLKGKITYGRVENVGNYRSFRLAATVEIDLTAHTLEEATENLIGRLDEIIETKKKQLMKV